MVFDKIELVKYDDKYKESLINLNIKPRDAEELLYFGSSYSDVIHRILSDEVRDTLRIAIGDCETIIAIVGVYKGVLYFLSTSDIYDNIFRASKLSKEFIDNIDEDVIIYVDRYYGKAIKLAHRFNFRVHTLNGDRLIMKRSRPE